MAPNMAATESTLELDEQERTRLQKAIQTVAGRRDGEIRAHPVAERANLSTEVVQEALDRAADAGTCIEKREDGNWQLRQASD